MAAAAPISRPDPLLRPVLLCGAAAPLLYALTVMWGATLFPGYSHIADPISGLTQTGRGGSQGLQSLFLIYNALVIAYAFAGLSLSKGRPFRLWSFLLLFVTAAGGLLMWPFPQDPIGAPATATGTTHIVLAAIESLASVGAIGLAALDWRSVGNKAMTRFSAVCLAAVVLTGPFAGMGAAFGWPVMGLFERLTIGGFEVWLFGTAALLYRSAR